MTADSDPFHRSVIYTLRPLAAEDEDFSFEVYAGTRTAELQLLDWSPEQKNAFLRMQFMAQRQHYHLNYPQALWQVIEYSGRAVGRLITDDTSPSLFILMDIALLPEFRGQGLGTAILQDLLRAADGAGKTMSLHVEQENPARHLYQRLGFVNCGQDGFYLEMKRQPAAGAQD